MQLLRTCIDYHCLNDVSSDIALLVVALVIAGRRLTYVQMFWILPIKCMSLEKQFLKENQYNNMYFPLKIVSPKWCFRCLVPSLYQFL